MRAVTSGLKFLILRHDHVPPTIFNLLLHLYMRTDAKTFPLYGRSFRFFLGYHVLFSILPYYSCFLLIYELASLHSASLHANCGFHIYYFLTLLGIRFGLVYALRTEHSTIFTQFSRYLYLLFLDGWQFYSVLNIHLRFQDFSPFGSLPPFIVSRSLYKFLYYSSVRYDFHSSFHDSRCCNFRRKTRRPIRNH